MPLPQDNNSEKRCTCQKYCQAPPEGKAVSASTYYDHRKQPELEANMALEDLERLQSRVRGKSRKENKKGLAKPTPGHFEEEDFPMEDAPLPLVYDSDEPQFNDIPSVSDSDDAHEDEITPDDGSSTDSSLSDGEADTEDYGEGFAAFNEIVEENLDQIHAMCDYIKNYDFDEERKQWTEDQWEQFYNPPQTLLDLDTDPDLRLSIEFYLALSHSSEETYAQIRQAYIRRHPDTRLLSYDQVRRRLQSITGIFPLHIDKCKNNRMAFIGPFAELNSCSECGEE
ncbi:hypothetical protein VNI00_015505 [Paramarasmius palmivorus]|uniref:Uncharacterized protein n=1 Tax=Paramarasmius palmivorus TaxID=297713 RepID=A0AAW0BLE3_9AGAR